MLQFLRRKRSLIMWIISPVIVVSFVFFYGWSGIGPRRGAPNELLEIGGRSINLQEFYMEEQNVERYFRMIYEGQLPPNAAEQFNFRRMALNQLLDRYYFLAGSDMFRIPVSQDLIRRNIYTMFRGINDFETALQRYLSQTNMSEQSFFSLVESEVASQAFSDMVRQSGVSSAADIQRYFRDNHQKRRINYVRFRSAEFMDDVEYTDEELQSFYEETKENYQVPEQYEISYVQFRPADVMDEIEVTGEQIRNYYEINLSRYREQERRDLKRIFVSVDDPEDEELIAEKRAQIEEVRNAIVEGESEFTEMAMEYSDGPEGERGGDFGVRSINDLPGAFGRPVFELDEGDISPVLEDRRGFYIFKVQSVLPERTRELDEVRDQISQTIRQNRARDLVMEKAEELRVEISTLDELLAYAEAHDLEVHESGTFSTRNIPGLGSVQQILDQARQLRVNELGDPVRARNNGVVFGLNNVVDSYIPPLEDIEVQVREELRHKMATEMAEDNARRFRARLRGDYVNFDNVAADFEKEIRTTEELSRSRDEVDGVGKSRELVRYIFDARLHQIGPLTEMVNEETGEVDTFVVWYCSDKIEADEETVNNNWGRAYNFWASRYGNSLRFAMYVYLQDQVPMRVLHPEMETMLR